MKMESQTVWQTDSGRDLVRQKADGTYDILPANVDYVTLCDLHDALADIREREETRALCQPAEAA